MWQLIEVKPVLESFNPTLRYAQSILGLSYFNLGQLNKAVPIYQQILAKTKLANGDDHSEILGVMHTLALFLAA